MKRFEFRLIQFFFPRELPNRKANFRFIVDLRFIDQNGRHATEHAVMPGLDTFWECDTGESNKLNYVRDCGTNRDSCARFNMKPKGNKSVHEWDRLILVVMGYDIHSIQFTVYDVDRRDVWDNLRNFLKETVGAVIGNIKAAIPGNLPSPLSDSFGGFADDVESFVLKKLAGGDKILFRGSCAKRDFEKQNNSSIDGMKHLGTIEGKGRGKNEDDGKYKICFSVYSTTCIYKVSTAQPDEIPCPCPSDTKSQEST